MEQKKEDNGEAIASSMLKMASLKVPIIAIVIGEGSSGGALALGVGNKRVTSTVIKDVTVKIPVSKDGEFDIVKQREMAEEILNITNIINKIKNELESVTNINLKF